MNLEKVLKSYGLTEKQAKIYLACLELGSSSVQKISQKSNIARSTSYEILESLRELSLISTFRKKKIKYYSAEDPQKIINSSKEKVNTLEQALPQFRAVYGQAKKQPTVRLYQGKSGMKLILSEILQEAKEVLAFGSSDDVLSVLDQEWPDFVQRRIKNKIPVKLILRESAKARERQRLAPQSLREVKIIPAEYDYHGVIFVWKDKIAMFSLEKELIALVIESKELTKIQSTMFQVIWDSLLV